MRSILILVLILLSVVVRGQDKKESLLQIVGSARVIVKPDVGILNIRVSEVEPKMSGAIKTLGDKSNVYLDLLQKIGFSGKEIKTTKFAVSKNRVYRKNVYVDSGYVASQEIRLEFKYEQNTLSDILNSFSNTNEEADFSFDFKLSDSLKAMVQSQIIDLAVKDAKSKAGDIATSSNLKLIKISKISYGGWGRDSGMEKIEREHQYAAAASGGSQRVFNFTPDDLIFRDTISIDWEIEEK